MSTLLVRTLKGSSRLFVRGIVDIQVISGVINVMGATVPEGETIRVSQYIWEDGIPITVDSSSSKTDADIKLLSVDTLFGSHPADATVDSGIVIPSSWSRFSSRLIEDNLKMDLNVLVKGAKGAGKSTLLKYIANQFVTSPKERCDVLYLDLDPGQPELSLPGVLSLALISAPLLEPAHAHINGGASGRIIASIFLGEVTPSEDPEAYLRGAARLVREAGALRKKRSTDAPLPLIVNSCGWATGLGWNLLMQLERLVSATHVATLGDISPFKPVANPLTHHDAMLYGQVVTEELAGVEATDAVFETLLDVAGTGDVSLEDDEALDEEQPSPAAVAAAASLDEQPPVPTARALRWLRSAASFNPLLASVMHMPSLSQEALLGPTLRAIFSARAPQEAKRLLTRGMQNRVVTIGLSPTLSVAASSGEIPKGHLSAALTGQLVGLCVSGRPVEGSQDFTHLEVPMEERVKSECGVGRVSATSQTWACVAVGLVKAVDLPGGEMKVLLPAQLQGDEALLAQVDVVVLGGANMQLMQRADATAKKWMTWPHPSTEDLDVAYACGEGASAAMPYSDMGGVAYTQGAGRVMTARKQGAERPALDRYRQSGGATKRPKI